MLGYWGDVWYKVGVVSYLLPMTVLGDSEERLQMLVDEFWKVFQRRKLRKSQYWKEQGDLGRERLDIR